MNAVVGALQGLGVAAAGLGVAASLGNLALYNVDGGEMAVIFNRFSGINMTPVGEGTHFLIPFVETPYIYDVRTHVKQIVSMTGTKDLQMVNVTVRMLNRPRAEKLSDIHKQYGRTYEDRILPSIGNEVLKATVAKYNAEALITKREEVSKEISRRLRERAEEFNILLDDVAITHLTFGTEFTRAVEAKQVAEQEAERQRLLVQVSEQEKIAAVTRATGEADAAKMISEATARSGRSILELRRIEAAKKIASTLSRSSNVVYLPGGGQHTLLNLNPGGR